MSPLVTLEELQKNYTDYNKDIIDNSEIIDKLLQESRINYTYDSQSISQEEPFPDNDQKKRLGDSGDQIFRERVLNKQLKFMENKFTVNRPAMSKYRQYIQEKEFKNQQNFTLDFDNTKDDYFIRKKRYNDSTQESIKQVRDNFNSQRQKMIDELNDLKRYYNISKLESESNPSLFDRISTSDRMQMNKTTTTFKSERPVFKSNIKLKSID